MNSEIFIFTMFFLVLIFLLLSLWKIVCKVGRRFVLLPWIVGTVFLLLAIFLIKKFLL